MSQKIQFFLIVCIAIATGALVLNARRPQEPVLQEITINQPDERVIAVYGRSEIKGILDKAEFLISFVTNSKELSDARMESEKNLLKINDILQSHAIESKNIYPGDLQIKVNTTYTDPKTITYSAWRAIKVTLYDLAELGPLFTDLQEAGFTKIENINLSASKIDSYREQALQLAIMDAKERAQTIATVLDHELGQPVTIDVSWPSTGYNFFYKDLTAFFQDATFISEITIGGQAIVKFEMK